MFLPRAILVSVGRSIPVLWVRTGSEPDFNPKNSTTSWRDSTVNIFSPESPSLLLKGFVSSLIVSLNLHTYIRLLMKTMWYESSRTDTNGPCDEVFFFFFSDWWETLQITPTMRLQGCVGFCMVCCDAKKNSSFLFCFSEFQLSAGCRRDKRWFLCTHSVRLFRSNGTPLLQHTSGRL